MPRTNDTTDIRRPLLPKQMQFMRANAPEVMFSGAFGAGKTRVLCEKALERAVNYAGNRVGLFRQTAVALRATTLRTPPRTYTRWLTMPHSTRFVMPPNTAQGGRGDDLLQSTRWA